MRVARTVPPDQPIIITAGRIADVTAKYGNITVRKKTGAPCFLFFNYFTLHLNTCIPSNIPHHAKKWRGEGARKLEPL